MCDILQNLHHLHPGWPSLMCRHNHLVSVNVDNVPVHVHVLEEAVIDRDGLVSPELDMGVLRLVHEHAGQHRVIGLGVRQRGGGHLQHAPGLVVVKHLEKYICILKVDKNLPPS